MNTKTFHRPAGTILALLFVLLTACKPAGEAADLPFIGTNMWYASELAVSDPVRFSSELDSLCARGLTNVRILATGEDWKGLDAALEGFSRHGMKAVLFLNNAWEWSADGYRSWLEKAGAGRQPHPAVDGYVAYMTAMAGFASNAEAVALYQEHVRRVVTRYKDSDAVYSWQICNEPRPFSRDSAAVDAFVAYVQGTAALIKSIDTLHKVSTGNEGAMGCNDGDYALCERLNDCPDIDYMTVHIWPYNWGWVKEDAIAEGVDAGIGRTAEYIDRHLEIARRLGKKVVIEEFGYPRDGFSFSREAPVEGRNRYYGYIFSRVLESARRDGALLGCNFWAWSGLARQTPGHDFWQEGDDLCGDPSQEGQGLNGVYLTDTGTLAVVSAYQDSLRRVVSVRAEPDEDWMFYGAGPFELRAEVAGSIPLAGLNVKVFRDLDLMDPDAKPVLSRRLRIPIRPGRWSEVRIPLGTLEPGFYRVDLGGVRSFNIGVNPEQIQSPTDAPEDFDAFWTSTLAELSQVPMTVRYTEIPEHSSDLRTCYHVEIPSWGGATMGGIVYVPVAEGKYPVHIEFMGYGAEPYYRDPSAGPDRIDYLVSVRDQGIFKAGNGEWIDRGLSSKEDFYYRGAFCDVVRAVDFAAFLPKAHFRLRRQPGRGLHLDQRRADGQDAGHRAERPLPQRLSRLCAYRLVAHA